MAVWFSKSSYFVLFRHKNRFLATLFIPCTPSEAKLKSMGAKLKSIGQN